MMMRRTFLFGCLASLFLAACSQDAPEDQSLADAMRSAIKDTAPDSAEADIAAFDAAMLDGLKTLEAIDMGRFARVPGDVCFGERPTNLESQLTRLDELSEQTAGIAACAPACSDGNCTELAKTLVDSQVALSFLSPRLNEAALDASVGGTPQQLLVDALEAGLWQGRGALIDLIKARSGEDRDAWSASTQTLALAGQSVQQSADLLDRLRWGGDVHTPDGAVSTISTLASTLDDVSVRATQRDWLIPDAAWGETLASTMLAATQQLSGLDAALISARPQQDRQTCLADLGVQASVSETLLSVAQEAFTPFCSADEACDAPQPPQDYTYYEDAAAALGLSLDRAAAAAEALSQKCAP